MSELRIKIFADGADLADIARVAEDPLIAGFTTNPSLLKKAGVADYATPEEAVHAFGMLATLFGVSPLITILGMVVVGSLPFGWVWLKMRRRLQAFEDQLPDLLITIAASLKAGHSFKQGLQAVVDEGHPPANKEIKRVLTEASLGRSMDDALADMSERLGSKNFEFAITAVTIQRQVGGSLATLFDMVADTVRQRQQFSRKVKALTVRTSITDGSFTAIEDGVLTADEADAFVVGQLAQKKLGCIVNYVYVDEPFKKDLDYYSLTVNWDDELVKATALTKDGAVIHPNFQPKA